MDRETLRTGEVAAQAGVNVQTLRYYERRGLLKEPERRSSGYRGYPPDAVKLIRFIKRAQELGFTLAEIEDLPRLRSDQDSACSEVRAAAEAKIEEKVHHLRAMKRARRVLVAFEPVGARTTATDGPDVFARQLRKVRKLDQSRAR